MQYSPYALRYAESLRIIHSYYAVFRGYNPAVHGYMHASLTCQKLDSVIWTVSSLSLHECTPFTCHDCSVPVDYTNIAWIQTVDARLPLQNHVHGQSWFSTSRFRFILYLIRFVRLI